MSELAISSTNWLAISLRNGAAIVFNLNEFEQWQYLHTDEPVKKQQTEENDEENSSDLNRNLIRFSPNGQRLAVNGQNKQIYIYVPSTTTFWTLQRIISVKKRASALDLTDEVLLIADKSGDVYKVDLSLERTDPQITLTADDCLMGHLSMLLDIAFVHPSSILTADRDEKIRLSYYPNAYNIQGYCLGHTEFVSHVKPIDHQHILSASGDGTLRLWEIPTCIELNRFDTKMLISSSQQVFYSSDNNPQLTLDLSSIDASIWKMALLSSQSDVFLALSIYASRAQSIYLTTLSNLKTNPLGQSFQLTFDSQNGTILDYCFPSILKNDCDLYILFDSNRLIRVNINSIFNEKSIVSSSNDNSLEKINEILNEKEYHPMNNLLSNMVMFKQLFKSRGQPGDCSYYKRKNERIEQEEAKRKKKQVQSPEQ